MAMHMLNGRELAAVILNNVRERVLKLQETPGLAIVLVGDDPASHLYVSRKKKACEETGIHFEQFLYPAHATTKEVLEKVRELNRRADIHGILVQLPLPTQDEHAIISAIDPKKDVDGFHAKNQARLKRGEPCLAPATALGILKLLDATEETLTGKRAVVIGSDLFTEPLRVLLSERGVITDRLDPRGTNAELTSTYDILISVVGHPGLVTANMVKENAIVIDVGTTRVGDVTLGDVDPAVAEQKNGWMTPVPGGVGPMTVAMLLVNVLKAYQLQK